MTPTRWTCEGGRLVEAARPAALAVLITRDHASPTEADALSYLIAALLDRAGVDFDHYHAAYLRSGAGGLTFARNYLNEEARPDCIILGEDDPAPTVRPFKVGTLVYSPVRRQRGRVLELRATPPPLFPGEAGDKAEPELYVRFSNGAEMYMDPASVEIVPSFDAFDDDEEPREAHAGV